MELSVRDYGWDDAGFDSFRQHRDFETIERLADYRCEICRIARGSRYARGRRQLLPRGGRKLWERGCGPSQDSLHRLYGFARSRIADQQTRRRPGAWARL